MTLILASNSIGRKKLLEEKGYKFDVIPSTVDEEKIIGRDHYETIRLRAKEKGDNVLSLLLSSPNPYPLIPKPYTILSADSGVIIDDLHFEKPKDFEDGVRILSYLSGKTHILYTAFQIIATDEKGQEIKRISEDDKSYVTFRKMIEEEIKKYLTENPRYLKYAGGYAVGPSDSFIEKIDGSVSNVIGLPMEKFEKALEKIAR